MKTVENLGWLGMVCILAAYLLLSLGIIEDDLRYHGLMLVGASGVAIISYKKRAWQPWVLNILFALIALIAIGRILLLVH